MRTSQIPKRLIPVLKRPRGPASWRAYEELVRRLIGTSNIQRKDSPDSD